MHRTAGLPKDWWGLRAEASMEDPPRQDVVALRAENDHIAPRTITLRTARENRADSAQRSR